ncbi:MAG: NAD(P)H-hydrate epimerase [Methanobacteriota archaeon]|nr:MAG: NAD(P)H-hydrate epimerase [Euryarchaeota archaeon]
MLPGLTTAQMIEMDRIMVEEFKIPIELMMENAGLHFARSMVQNAKDAEKFLIVAGGGNNGGGGITAARRLKAWGKDVILWVASRKIREIPQRQLERFVGMNGNVQRKVEEVRKKLRTWEEKGVPYLVGDAYIGYGFTGSPSAHALEVFELIGQTERIISLDAPSGLNTTTGEMHNEFLPDLTLTIAFMKKGLVENPKQVGNVEVVDIGVPKQIFEQRMEINWEQFSIDELNVLYQNFLNKGKSMTSIYSSKGWKPNSDIS